MTSTLETTDILKQVILNTPQLVFWKDQKSVYQGCSQCFASLLGFESPEEIIGKTDQQLPWKEGYLQYQAEDQKVINEGSPLVAKVDIFFNGLISGKKIISIHKLPLYGDQNEIVGIAGYCTDITGEEQLLHQFKMDHPAFNFLKNKLHTPYQQLPDFKSQDCINALIHYYESIIACMPSNVYWLDTNCVLQGGNDNLAKIFGLSSRTELVGLTYEKMTQLANWTEGQGDHFRNTELEVMRCGIPKINISEPPITRNGQQRYYIATKVPLFDQEKNIIGVVGISTDITEKKLLEEQLMEVKIKEARSKAVLILAKMFSQELNIPLMVLERNVECLEKSLLRLIRDDKQELPKKDVLNQSKAWIASMENSIFYAKATASTVLSALQFNEFIWIDNFKAVESKPFILNKKKNSYIIKDYKNFYGLSRRQQECVFFLIRGYTYAQIARRLSIEVSTVQTHIEHVKEKLNLKTQAQVVEQMINFGFMCFIPQSLFSRAENEVEKPRDLTNF